MALLNVTLFAFCWVWKITKGYRFRPWRSPYIRWRMETAYRLDSRELTAKTFFGTLFRDRRQVWHFLRWVREMNSAK